MTKDLQEFFEGIERKDTVLAEYVHRNEALVSFLNEIDILKGRSRMTQKDMARKMGTTQSAVSRIESLKTNPTYGVLAKMAEAAGGKIFVTPMADMTLTVPLDLQEKVSLLAADEGKKPHDFLLDIVRGEIDSRYIERDSHCFHVDAHVFIGATDTAPEEFGERNKVSEGESLFTADDCAA